MRYFGCIYFALIFGTILLVVGCSQETENPLGADSDNIHEIYVKNDPDEAKSPGKNLPESISMKVGETVKLKIESNPTTGYKWTAKVSTDVLIIAKEDYFSSSDLLGAGGIQEFDFEAIKAGETDIIMNYGRSWEPNPINTYKIVANVQ